MLTIGTGNRNHVSLEACSSMSNSHTGFPRSNVSLLWNAFSKDIGASEPLLRGLLWHCQQPKTVLAMRPSVGKVFPIIWKSNEIPTVAATPHTTFSLQRWRNGRKWGQTGRKAQGKELQCCCHMNSELLRAEQKIQHVKSTLNEIGGHAHYILSSHPDVLIHTIWGHANPWQSRHLCKQALLLAVK